MIIKSLKLNNYRPYKNPEPIIFARGEKNITIIEGNNDTGKTSLMNAITWCLYDKEKYRDKGKEQKWNKAKVKEINEGEEFEVKVEILMEDNEGNNIIFTRKQPYIKINDDNCKEKSKSQFTIRYETDGDDEKIKTPETYIKNNLPEGLQEYFIFPGDKLKKIKTKEVKDGVHTLYQLDLLKNIQKQAKNKENEYNNQFKSINPELSELKEARSRAKEQKQEWDEKLEDNEIEITHLQEEIEEWREEIGGKDKDAKKILGQIEDVNKKKEDNERKKREAENKYSKLLIDNYSIVLSNILIKEIIDKWDDLELEEDYDENGEYNFSIELKDLKHILNDGKCICGNKIEIDTGAYKKIEELIEKVEQESAEKNISITSLKDDLIKVLKNIETRYPQSIKRDIKTSINTISALELEIKSQDVKLDALDLELDNLNNDLINDRKKRMKENDDEIAELREENGVLKENIKEFPEQLRKYDEDIKNAENEQEEKDEFEEKRDFCEYVKTASKEIYDTLAEIVHKELEERVTEEYKTIHWKPTYEKVIIKKNFDVEIKKTDGSTLSATDPSTGSRVVLALSFMAALNSLSGFKLPQIIDTPIATLSGNMRENTAKYLPKYMKNKQMVLLVMDTEYTDSFKENIKDFVGAKYNLKYHHYEKNGKILEETMIEKEIG